MTTLPLKCHFSAALAFGQASAADPGHVLRLCGSRCVPRGVHGHCFFRRQCEPGGGNCITAHWPRCGDSSHTPHGSSFSPRHLSSFHSTLAL